VKTGINTLLLLIVI